MRSMKGQNILPTLAKDSRFSDLQYIFKVFKNAGYEIYLVGGCVRDALLGRPIHDYDFATSALPEQVEALFPKTLDHGKNFGTITVVIEGVNYEITTFRAEMNYTDHRRPLSVNFSKSLEEDSCRRDFTINAFYVNEVGDVLDPQNGLGDLQARLIRCVGGHSEKACGLERAKERFNEDALRMYRALRFASQLNFTIEPHTFEALESLWSLTDLLSKERRYQEFKKLLTGPHLNSILPQIIEKDLWPQPLKQDFNTTTTAITTASDSEFSKNQKSEVLQCLKQRSSLKIPAELKFKVLLLELLRLSSDTLEQAQAVLQALTEVLSFSKEESKWLKEALRILYSVKSLRLSDEGEAAQEAAVGVLQAWSKLMSLSEMKLYFSTDIQPAPIKEEVLKELLKMFDLYQEVPAPIVEALDLQDLGLQGAELGKALNSIYRHQLMTGQNVKLHLLDWFRTQEPK